jgi:ketosteroid isomerase-like protein
MWSDHCQLNVRIGKCAYPKPKESKMTSKADVIRKWYEESWANPPSSNVDAAAKYFSDDYQGLDKDGNVISDKATIVGTTEKLMNAFKDFKGVLHDISEEGDSVIMTFHWEGTHTGDFDLSAMGMGVIPASGKRVETPESKSRFMVEGDQIVSSQPISGGFESLLAGIGVKPPSA